MAASSDATGPLSPAAELTLPPEAAGARLRGAAIKTISAAKIETIVARSVGIFGIVFGLQSVPLMYGQLHDLDAVWAGAINIGLFGGLILVAVATTFKRGVRLTTSWVAFAYLLALLLWPLTVTDPALFAGEKPWLWYLCTVATACAAIAFSVAWAAAYTVLVPVVYGALRTLPSGGSADTSLAVLDTVYAVILGLVVLIIITMLRQAARSVDKAQAAALTTYSTAVRQHATEVERIEVDSIVHDSVLTTLLSAANTRTPADEELAASMAREAIARLDAAGAVLPGDDRVVSISLLERRLRGAIAAFSAPVSVSIRHTHGLTLPVQVNEAIYSATVQALVNSMQHAEGDGSEAAGRRPVRRSLTLGGEANGRVDVVIADTGIGFDDTETRSARMGLRVSILERIAAVGGAARVRSAPGVGTTIEIHWPAQLLDETANQGEFEL